MGRRRDRTRRVTAAQTIARRYRLPWNVVLGIRKFAAEYGSQGRAIQVAAEFLSERKRRVVIPRALAGRIVSMSYKLTPRTIGQIDELAKSYGTRGGALSACVAFLAERERREKKQMG